MPKFGIHFSNSRKEEAYDSIQTLLYVKISSALLIEEAYISLHESHAHKYLTEPTPKSALRGDFI